MPTTSCSRFEIIRLHTSGGLGDVFIARDRELERDVALKRILDCHADNAASRNRFLREAMITGSLEHPGIVPVYGLGEGVDGRPFYAMRFIRGQTLKEAIDRYHLNRGDPAERTVELRQLLGRLIAVCNAVAYAHSHRILHRDLKPDNIMLGNYGETLVVDWGIAKAAYDCEEAATDSEELCPDMELPQSVNDCGGSTEVGSTLGTPQYMSPEQAAGLPGNLSPASDVYSLGATLYYLLSGKPPFAGVEADLIPVLVQEGAFRRPRQVNADVPVPLEAICLKAMARNPADRFPSARALADDLEQWLADQAVSAYPERWPERAGRWARRHKTLVWLLAAIVLLTGTVLISWVLLAAAQERQLYEQQRADQMEGVARERAILQEAAEQGRHDAEDQKQKAEENRALVRRYLYFSRINLADRAWQEAQIGAMLGMLEEERVTQKDLLGFEWHYLWRLQHSSIMTLEGHAQAVQAVAYSPDGSKVASGAEDRAVRIWNATTGQRILTIRRHDAGVNSIAFSPDGRYLASGSEDSTVRVTRIDGLHVARFENRATDGAGRTTMPPRETVFRGHSQSVMSVAFSHDGKRLASAGHDRVIRVWDVSDLRDGEVTDSLQELKGHQCVIRCVAFSADDSLLASCSGDSDLFKPGEVKIWDLRSGQAISSILDQGGAVDSLAFTPRGRLLATASQDRTVKIWDVALAADKPMTEPRQTLRGHVKGVLAVAFSADGKWLASASEDHTVKIWDVAGRAEIITLRGHASEVSAVAFAPAGNRVVSGSRDDTVRIWNPAASQETLTLEGHSLDVNCVAFCPGKDVLVTASDDKTLKLWNASDGKVIRTLTGHQAGVNGTAFSPDGNWLASGSQDGKIKFWNATSGEEALSIRTGDRLISSIAFSPQGKNLASAHADGSVRLWDVRPGAKGTMTASLKYAKGSGPALTCVRYNAAGTHFATGAEDGTLSIWVADSGTVVHVIKTSNTKLLAVAFSPDGTSLAAGYGDSVARLWSTTSGELLQTFKGHARMVASVVFSPDGHRLATGSDDQTIKLWDPITGEQALTLKGHRDTVTSLAFSADGYRLASAGDDWSVKLWNAAPPPTVAKPSKPEAVREPALEHSSSTK